MKILLLPSSLLGGGTERQVSLLAIGLRKRGHDVCVAVPYAHDRYQVDLEREGVPVVVLNRGARPGRSHPFRRLANVTIRVYALLRLTHSHQYDVVHGFGSTTNFYSSLVTLFSPACVVWGIRDSRSGPPKGSRLLERLLSRRASIVIANSSAGARSWNARGLEPGKMRVVHNGTDMQRFDIDPLVRQEVREGWGVSCDEIVVGIVGRLHPVKNHELFLRAAAKASTQDPRLRFVVVGAAEGRRLDELKELETRLNIPGGVRWEKQTHNPERVFNALDVVVSCSATEGFSNVLVEALACGTPCVATAVGDASDIVDGSGIVVDIPESTYVAAAIVQAGEMSRDWSRSDIRKGVVDRFSLERMVEQTESLLEDAVRGDRAGAKSRR